MHFHLQPSDRAGICSAGRFIMNFEALDGRKKAKAINKHLAPLRGRIDDILSASISGQSDRSKSNNSSFSGQIFQLYSLARRTIKCRWRISELFIKIITIFIFQENRSCFGTLCEKVHSKVLPTKVVSSPL